MLGPRSEAARLTSVLSKIVPGDNSGQAEFALFGDNSEIFSVLHIRTVASCILEKRSAVTAVPLCYSRSQSFDHPQEYRYFVPVASLDNFGNFLRPEMSNSY